MGISSKIRTIFRGDIPFYHLPHEALRRRQAASRRRTERATLDELNGQGARLLPAFTKLSSEELLEHFCTRGSPSFWPMVPEITGGEKARIKAAADAIIDESTWPLMGFGPLRFDGENAWRRDPLTAYDWGIDYHADTPFVRDDGLDVRVLWELNRLGHVLDLALAFAATSDERYAETFFSHVQSWMSQNPYARGANWGCAMEVALRAVNLLAAFDMFRISKAFTAERLSMMLRLFDQHGRFIVDNNEFSYIATSNHYLSDVVGLFWIGTLMPELEQGAEWRVFGLKEILREMDKQVLPDGADFESSMGYHKFVTEMFSATFLLAERNGIEISDHHNEKLDSMFRYLRGIIRPDGEMSLVGDCDGSRFLPLVQQQTWASVGSDAFPNAGIYVMRDGDLYLHFNASDCGVNGRGSHGHNDKLSIEVSAFGRPFIVDPGSYAYNLDLDARHMFRSTGHHSTVMIDGVEQNTILRDTPFIIGNEAAPKTLEWTTNDALDRASAEHYGYKRLKEPVTHRRTVEFNKAARYWLVRDDLLGSGNHEVAFSFHLAPEISMQISDSGCDLYDLQGCHLLVSTTGLGIDPEIVDSFYAPKYGERVPTETLRWTVETRVPFNSFFYLVPASDDNLAERLELIARLADNS